MPFSTVLQLYRSGQCTYPCFPGVLLTSTQHNTVSKLLSHITIVETMDSGEINLGWYHTNITLYVTMVDRKSGSYLDFSHLTKLNQSIESTNGGRS